MVAASLQTRSVNSDQIPFRQGRKPHRPHDREAIQELFPDLEIIELLGSGGMGSVFKAKQPGLERFVAIKILNPPFPSSSQTHSQFVARFTREAKTLAKLDHPNIVTIYDFGERDGVYFLTMEYVAAGDLGGLIKSGKIGIPAAFDIISQIGDAIQYAHSKGVTHRDLKPANILLDSRGVVKLADFGLAKILPVTGEIALTGDGLALGSPFYMAPEQSISPESVDFRSDLYSLGVICYELLTGKLPQGNFPRASECSPELGPHTDEALLKSMAHDPSARFRDVREMLAAFEPVMTSKIRLAKSEIPPTPAGRLPAKQATLLFIAILSLTATGWFWLSHSPQAPSSPAPSRSSPGLRLTEETIPELRPTSETLSDADLQVMSERVTGKTWRQQYGFFWVRFEREGRASYWNVDHPGTQEGEWTLLPDGGVFLVAKSKLGIGRVFDFPEAASGTYYHVQHSGGRSPFIANKQSAHFNPAVLCSTEPETGEPTGRLRPIPGVTLSEIELEIIRKRFVTLTWTPELRRPWKLTLHEGGHATHVKRDGRTVGGFWQMLPDGGVYVHTDVYNQHILDFPSEATGTALPACKLEDGETFIGPPDVAPFKLIISEP